MNRTLTIAIAGLALLSLATGCSNDEKVSMPELEQPNSSADLGSCHVKVTGDVNTEWTSTGGVSAVGYGPWLPRVGGTAPMQSFFILNCDGDGDNYVGFMPVNEAKIPMQPGTYTIEPATNVAGSSETGVMSSLLGLAGTDTNWGPSAQGQLVITAFDDEHIAGTFTIPVTDVLAHLNGSSKGDALIVGEFDYKNPT